MKNTTISMLRSVAPVAAKTCADPQTIRSVWRWGSDNLFPEALSTLSRTSTIHRRILNDKADYIAGRGLQCDPDQQRLAAFISSCNGMDQSLRWVFNRVAFDKCLLGNAFMELVTDENSSFLSVFHQDATRCRLAKESAHVVMHHNWGQFTRSDAKVLPLFPIFEKQTDGTWRSMIHYKDYEPQFENYGIPKYIAAMEAATIAYKTDRWNVSRLDNAFQPSGVMILDGQVDSSDEAAEIARTAERKFAGQPGQVMFMVKNGIEGDTTKFVPLNATADGDWRSLHAQSMSDIIIAHSWFRTLSGIDYTTGFSSERIQYEFQIALNLVICSEQQELLESLRPVLDQVLGVDSSSLVFVNRPPFSSKPKHMYVWEARRDDGLSYDASDPEQCRFLQ